MKKSRIILLFLLCAMLVAFGGCRQEKKKEQAAPPLEKEGYVLDWHDEFDGDELDFSKWLPQYLPHVTTVPSGAAADYEIGDGILKLKISEGRTPLYGNESGLGFKVSGLQTYNKNGLHEQSAAGVSVVPFEGYATQYGYFEIRTKIPSYGGGGHVAFWMIGTEADARADGTGSLQKGEIDILETMTNAPNFHMPKVFAWTDEDLHDWRAETPIEGDVINEWHTYAVDWTPEYLAFYVDGVEISRTEQSPSYEMCIFLSMYINDDPNDNSYWAGPPSDVYPKEWEIDYVRVYKDENGYPNGKYKSTETAKLPGSEGAVEIQSQFLEDVNAPVPYFDVAATAEMSFSDKTSAMYIEAVNSRFPVTYDGFSSDYLPEFPNEATFMWDEPQTVDTVNLFVRYAVEQAPTSVEIQTLKEGGEWEKAINYTITWQKRSDYVEYAKMQFPNGENIIGVKVIIHYANMYWNMYTINKIHIYDSSKEAKNPGDPIGTPTTDYVKDPENLANLAPMASIATSPNMQAVEDPESFSSDHDWMKDGYVDENSYVRVTSDDFCKDDWIEFTWEQPVAVDQVVLFNQFSGQAPRAWNVSVTTDGKNWKQVVETGNVQWSEDKAEGKVLKFKRQSNVIGLRVQITDASVIWGHYTIYEIKIFGSAEYGTPTSNFVKAPAGLTNLAPQASVTLSDAMLKVAKPDEWSNNPLQLTDGVVGLDAYTRDADGNECKNDWIEFVWDAPVTVEQVVLFNKFRGQAPTAWKVLVTQDGTNWKQVSYTGNVPWAEETAQGKVLKFAKQENVIGLRLQITAANMQWGHYTIGEVEIYGVDPNAQQIPMSDVTNFTQAPEGLKNLAPDASISLSDAMQAVAKPDAWSSNPEQFTDGVIGVEAYERSADGTQCKDDWIDFTWDTPVSVEQVVLYNEWSGQAPTAWNIYVTTDGENWKPVVGAQNVQWIESGVEGKVLSFAKQENILGLRVEITAANVGWGHYTICEVEIYGTAAEDPGEPEIPMRDTTNFLGVPSGLKNLAPNATIEISQTILNVLDPNAYSSDPDWMNDGRVDENSFVRPATGAKFEDDWYEFSWGTPVSVEQVVLFNQYSGQAPTAWNIYVTSDGENWKPVVGTENVQWSESDAEGKTLSFARQENVIGLRVQILGANIEWGHYCIYELFICGIGSENVATSATLTVPDEIASSITNLKCVNDGYTDSPHWRSISSMANANDYYQFNWSTPASVDGVVLWNQWSGQAPTAWKVFVTRGNDEWTQVASVDNVTWSEDQLERKSLFFARQEGITGLRVQIVDANLIWGGYTIYELEILGNCATNYAAEGTVTASDDVHASGAQIAHIHDGYATTSMWRAAATLEGANDYYQFNWSNPISVDQVVLWNQFSGQAPTAWKIFVTTGNDQWTEVASVDNVTWTESDYESKVLSFARQENITGLRIQIVDANLIWSGYTIYEVDILDTTQKV